MSRSIPLALFLSLALGPGCTPEEPAGDDPSPLLEVEASAAWTIPGMTGTAHVVTTDMGVPHVFAEDDGDLGRAVGFVLARDRYFYMDVARRLSLGTVSALLGDQALETDVEQRGFAATFLVDRMVELLEVDPAAAAYFDGVAEGVNAYVAAVRDGELPGPSEYEVAAGLLGADAPEDLLTDFTRRDVVAGMVTILYETGFETKDVGRAAAEAALDDLFVGAPFEDLRRGGVFPGQGREADVWGRPEPVHLVAAAPDWQPTAQARETVGAPPVAPRVPAAVLQRLQRHTERLTRRLGQDWEHGFGSNAWAVSADASADGRAMVATDGHLDLTVPPLFYQIGIDTEHLGGGDIHQVGMMTPAMPLISTGTNGDVAFGQTQLIGDITDWYAEEIVLDDDGAPRASVFQGAEEALLAFDESIGIAEVPLLGSEAGTFSFTRYTTFDGRWITSMEGTEVSGPDEAGDGETAVHLMGEWIVPGDTDGDGVISAVSFDYAGLDISAMASVIRQYSAASDLDAFAEATEDLVAYSLNLVAADRSGDILYTGFQAVPCRGYLAREADGSWAPGADPNVLLDGTTYGGFTIPIGEDGRVDPAQGSDDPYRCVVPWEDYPHSRDPEQGFLVSANNDPGGLTFDGSLTDDPYYIGGPWMEGFRAEEITEDLAARAADGGVSLDDMKAVQANHTSVIAKLIATELTDAVAAARQYADDVGSLDPDSPEQRMADLYLTDADALDEAADRIAAWAARGWPAASGVETFYHPPTDDDREDAVATMIFNAWMGRYVDRTVDDEGIPGLGWPTGDTGRFRLLRRMLDGRGPGNPLDMGSFNPDTQESIYFDDQATPQLDTSEEVALAALVDALAWLRGPAAGPGEGGFDTDDMDAWLWGLRHWVRFDSLLAAQFGLDDPLLSPLIEPLNITPSTFPIAEGLAPDDPRADLPGFPRPADNLCVDAGNSGTDGLTFDYDSGSVWRLVVALGDDGFEAYNVIPGGQSGLVDSEHFADQATLWLGNEYLPVWLGAEDVAAHAVRRETFSAP